VLAGAALDVAGDQHDTGPVPNERFGDAVPDALARAGHDDRWTGETPSLPWLPKHAAPIMIDHDDHMDNAASMCYN
jgi:hypothetical protein